ncbi:hypothetical protein [Frankia sp. Cas3]|uniref:hypothetical protein n=1 Tax=Frankia sp. Cas3 TaxID=3073926 RepID=UPI002AD43FE5|nr:hypothetical protein [Frankia sp. Cas3]
MASIERTAFPRFRKVVSAWELHEAFTPSAAEVRWGRQTARTEANLLVLMGSGGQPRGAVDLCAPPVEEAGG